jgi:hypothetical protein
MSSEHALMSDADNNVCPSMLQQKRQDRSLPIFGEHFSETAGQN